MKTVWINTGFERNTLGEITMFWECDICGFELEKYDESKPACECPVCGRGEEA